MTIPVSVIQPVVRSIRQSITGGGERFVYNFVTASSMYATIPDYKALNANNSVKVKFKVTTAATGTTQRILNGVADSGGGINLRVNGTGFLSFLYRDVANAAVTINGPAMADGQTVSVDNISFSPAGVTLTVDGVDFTDATVASPITWKTIASDSVQDFFGGTIWDNQYFDNGVIARSYAMLKSDSQVINDTFILRDSNSVLPQVPNVARATDGTIINGLIANWIRQQS